MTIIKLTFSMTGECATRSNKGELPADSGWRQFRLMTTSRKWKEPRVVSDFHTKAGFKVI